MSQIITSRGQSWPTFRSRISIDEDEDARREMLFEMEQEPPPDLVGDLLCDLPIISSTACPECGASPGRRCFEGRDDTSHYARASAFARQRGN